MGKKDNKWINGIDSLRFFLALIVLLSHLPNVFAVAFKNSPNAFVHNLGLIITPLFSGTSAVIAFFIISGFVIHNQAKDTILDVKSFLVRRWVRVGLPLLIIGGFALYLGVFGYIPVWSLYCELIFYTLYPLLRLLKITWKLKFIFAFVASYLVVLIFARGEVMSLFHQANENLVGQYWHVGLSLVWIVGLPCWLLGVLLAEEFDTINLKVSRLRLWSFRVGIFILSVLIQVLRYKYFASTLITENIFALFMFFWLRGEIAYYKENKSVAFFEKLGKFSFSLYLCQRVLIVYMLKFIPLTFLTYPVYILVIISISYLVYLVIESPSHQFAKWIAPRK